MHASARHAYVSTFLLVFVAIFQMNCAEGDETLPMPGGGVLAPPGEAESGAGGDDGDDGDVGFDPDDERIYAGPCDEEGLERVCMGYNEAGCARGVQTCADSVWTECLFAGSYAWPT